MSTEKTDNYNVNNTNLPGINNLNSCKEKAVKFVGRVITMLHDAKTKIKNVACKAVAVAHQINVKICNAWLNFLRPSASKLKQIHKCSNSEPVKLLTLVGIIGLTVIVSPAIIYLYATKTSLHN